MKRKIVALAMALAMALTSSFTVFARFDDANFVYQSTENVVATIFEQNKEEKIVLTWPAVDTSGNLINANPLKADGQVESTGNPTRGWTNPTQGMIIEYDGWLPDGTHNSIKNDNKTTHNVLFGVTDRQTDYPIVIKDPKTGDVVKEAYVDTTVVATSFATAYQIQYSEDGVTWVQDHIASTINHGKKLSRRKADGSIADDNKNTFYLEDQITEALTATLKPETQYYIRVNAFDASTPSTMNAPYKTFETTIVTPKVKELKPAFPTVEGGGYLSQGGREGDVYVVTNLTDSVSDPQPGSFRYGLERRDRKDGNKTAPRTIVFAVGGTINVDPTATKGSRRININSNTTILGQTAPGEGITLAGMSVKFDGENIIARYLRTRLGAGYDQDAATATGKNIVIDHCTFEWGTDETFTAKELVNSSIQYNIIASGLAMVNKNGELNTDAEINSAESEAKHGMGSLLNGYETSITHNLWAHNGTRNPRLEGGFTYNNVTYNNKMEFSNNVVYNWGHNSAYGGERGNGEVNYTNNYFKPGPNTLSKVKNFLFDCDSSSKGKSSYYINGNVMDANAEVTTDNTKGFNEINNANILTSPVELVNQYIAETANEAYENVLNNVGASYFRDAQDIRLINDVKTGGGRFINDPVEAGGYETEVFTQELADTDSDGIPDNWETAHNLNPNDATDSAKVIEDETSPYDGYSWIEVYGSDILGEWDNTNKQVKVGTDVKVLSINDESGANILNMAATPIETGKKYTVNVDGSAVKYEVYLNDEIVGENTGKAIEFSTNKEGMFNLAVKATYSIDNNKTKAFSELIPVVSLTNKNNNLKGFTSTDVGAVKTNGIVSYDGKDNTMIMGSTGKIGITAANGTKEPDSFLYNYKQVTGDVTITAKVNPLAKLDYYQKAGVMLRSSLDPESEFYMSAVTFVKGEDYEGTLDASGNAVKAKNVRSFARTSDGLGVANGKFVGVALKRLNEEPNYGWVRIVKKDQNVKIYGSNDGEGWTILNEYTTTLPETFYVGFAVDAVQDTHELVRYNAAEFSNISIKTAESIEGKVLGDATNDGKVTATDAAAILKYVKGSLELSDKGISNIDVDGTENATASTAAMVLAKVRDKDYKFPIEM